LHRWLAFWIPVRERGSTPWPGWAGVSIDSRAIRPGELFIAIHGPRHDGHTFVADVLEGGALAAVVAQERLAQIPEPARARCIVVADTFVALKQLARKVRDAWGGKIAGITGSVGKTTTKEILAALLGTRLRILKSEGNFNNEYGLPLTLFKLDETHEAAVLEWVCRGAVNCRGWRKLRGRTWESSRAFRPRIGIFFLGG